MSAPDKDSPNFRELVDGFLEGTLSDSEFNTLQSALRERPDLRDRYFASVRIDTLLRERAGTGVSIAATTEAGAPSVPENVVAIDRAESASPWSYGWGLAASLVLGALLLGSLWPSGGAAEIGITDDAVWLATSRAEGEGLRVGDEVALVSGSVEIHFDSGAFTRIHGPAAFEITGTNSGFLHHGQAWSRADTESSHGFTIQTHSGRFVDRGTEFLTTARTDGFSQMQVTSGAVDAEIEGFEPQRFEKGSGLGIEPGETPVRIVIESGNENPDFAFPTIPPPTSNDHADVSKGYASVQLNSLDRKGRTNLPHIQSGPPESLLDGKAQTARDQPGESFFFPNGATGEIVLDLGEEIPVARVHTYSWHLSEVDVGRKRRAVQRYTLWASGKTRPDSLPSGESGNGWTRVARVDTDAFFGVQEDPDRPAQQAVAIQSSGPSLGNFRYLLFQVLPTPMPEDIPSRHTFFGEIDVFTSP